MTQQHDLVKDRITQWLPTAKDPHTITVHPSRLLIAMQLTHGTHHAVRADMYAVNPDNLSICPTQDQVHQYRPFTQPSTT